MSVEVADPFLTEADTHRRVHDELDSLRRLALKLDVPPANHERHLDNEATQQWLAISPYVAEWTTTLVPSAIALQTLQDPTPGTTLPSGTEIDRPASDRFRYVLDAIGVRSRAAVMEAVMTSHFRDAHRDLKWLSLACGTAVPAFQASRNVAATTGTHVSLTLADWDPVALRSAQAIAARMGTDRVHTAPMNITDADALLSLGESRFDAIDILGFFEYLRSQPSGRMHVTASAFLSLASRLMRPGGLLVFGNMLDTHPQLDFHRRVVQWPLVQPRSLPEIVSLVDQAAIPRDRVKIFLPSDGVFAVLSVAKSRAKTLCTAPGS